MWYSISAAVVLFFCTAPILASDGDDLFIFDDCVYQCVQLSCYNNVDYKSDYRWDRDWVPDYNDAWEFDAIPLPLHLTVLGWGCELNCDYQCQRIVTQIRIDEGHEILQFHGKWPFQRVFGIQELASVIFSIGNFIPHFVGAKKIIAAIHVNSGNSLKQWQYANALSMAIITMFAWVASTIFHIRDFELTEKTDYFLAGLTVLTGFHGIAARVFKLYLPEKKQQALALFLGCCAAYSAHVTKLIIDWLYTYNMQANVAVALLQNCCWCLLCYNLYSSFYSLEAQTEPEKVALTPSHLKYINTSRTILSSFFTRSPKLYSLYPLVLLLIVASGMSLEIFDFPPFFYDLIDAHALWHLVTIIPATYGLYDWLIWDIQENVISELDSLDTLKNR